MSRAAARVPERQRRAAGDGAPAARPRDLAGALKFGLADVRDALERASARQTAATVAAGAVAKALLVELGVEVAGSGCPSSAARRTMRRSARRSMRRGSDRDTLGGVIEVRARGCPGFGVVREREERLDGRLAAALSPSGGQGRRDRRRLRARPAAWFEAHDEIVRDERGIHRETNRAGGIEAGVSNGQRSSCGQR